jgi:ribosome-interacting GTPase 1
MTRIEKIADLEKALQRSPSNSAIERHLNKVKAMSDAQFADHLIAQEEMLAKFRASGSAARMIREIR